MTSNHASANRIALAHDVLAARAGGERVLIALAQTFPDAPIHTLLHEPAATFDALTSRQIEGSWLGRWPWLRANYRHAVPIAALTFASKQIDADVTVCSTSGLSHHVRTTGAKIVYCHTPARWLHDRDTYLRGYNRAIRAAAKTARPGFAHLDHTAMRSADHIIANSAQVASEITSIYGRDATVVHPCSTFDIHGAVKPISGLEPGFVLSPTRPLGYKRLDVLFDAAHALPDRTFVQIGGGPHRDAVLEGAPANVRSLGSVPDDQLRWAYQNASVVALTCAEDYGLVPLEAAAHGVHTVAPAARGILDHRTDHMTNYDFASVDALVDVLQVAPAPTGTLDSSRLEADRFGREINAIVERFL